MRGGEAAWRLSCFNAAASFELLQGTLEEKDEQPRAMILIVLGEMVAAATGCLWTSWGGVSWAAVGRGEGPVGKAAGFFSTWSC